MADVKLLKYDGTEQQYLGVERVQLAKVDGGTAIFSEGEAVEGIEIAPDFSAGDMTVLAPAGTLVKSAVILQPETLVPENIRRGVSVAGIEGELIGDTEELAVELDMSEGNQIIVPTQEGKVISQVTVTKPETLVPENILAGVDIGGVVGELDQPELEETEVELDFSAGAMEVVPLDGKVFSKVSIPVPEGLVPENIAESETVAGIIGKLKKAIIKTGYSSASETPFTFNHGLGVIPDLVVIFAHTGMSTSGAIYFSIGFSEKGKEALGFTSGAYVHDTIRYGSSSVSQNVLIEGTGGVINNANENSFTAGSSIAPIDLKAKYRWYAIGGLT